MSEDAIELSSDSNDTIIVSTHDNDAPQKSFDDCDSDVENIINKYISTNCTYPLPSTSSENKISPIKYKDIESIDEDLPYVPLIKKLKKTSPICSKNELLSESSSSQEGTTDTLQILSKKYSTILKDLNPDPVIIDDVSKPPSEKEKKKLERQQKAEERQKKKAEAEREKKLKQAMLAANKNMKPGECMKYICVNIDNEIISEEYGSEIVNSLQNSEIKYKVSSQVFPNTISWIRTNQAHFIDDDGNLTLSPENCDTDEILLIMKCKDFIEHVHNNTLITHIQCLKSVLENKKIILAIFNLQNYQKHQINKNHKEFESLLAENDDQQPTRDKRYQNYPDVTKKSIEFALTELQLLCNCSHRLLNSTSEVGLLVTQLTKSVAELPYKRQKQEKYQQTDWFASGDSKDCVKVDKNGNGLQRLWKQMLTTFPMANLETAEAITNLYPTLFSLMEAYEDCQSAKPEQLLQDIPIRRAAGPLSSRRLGPELSKKVHNFFNSTDGDTLL